MPLFLDIPFFFYLTKEIPNSRYDEVEYPSANVVIIKITTKFSGTFLTAKTKIWQKIKKYYQPGTQYRSQPTYSFPDVLFHCYITLYSYTFDFGCEITIQICQMVAKVQILLFLFKTFCDTDYLLIFFINKRHNQILP